MQTITASPLDPNQFAPYGDVIQATGPGSTINYGHTDCFSDLARLDLQAASGRPGVSIYRAQPLPSPPVIKLFERHALGSQLFFPLKSLDYLVVVALPGEFDPKSIRVFCASGSQGINYHPGVWHHYCLALHPDSEFLVVDRVGPQVDVEEFHLPPHLQFNIEVVSGQVCSDA